MVLVALAVGCLAMVGGAATAAAKNISNTEAKALAKKLVDCPTTASEYCVYAETLSGEFKIGSKTAPIEHPLVLQGGLATLGTYGNANEPLIPPLWGGEEVSKTAQELPGGLTGISSELGGPVTATAELVSGASVILNEQDLLDGGNGVKLPLKVHLQNELLGENCYIGSNEDPVVIELTDHTTEPPSGTEPISGEVGDIIPLLDKGRLLELKGNKLVGNSFAAPAATGCGVNVLTEAVTTALVNTDAGLPSAAGKNVAILSGNTYLAEAAWVAKLDKKEIKEKVKAAKGSK
jgi:hypothetical protein